MADDSFVFSLVLVFLYEFSGSREGDLVDVFLDFFRGHTDTVIRNRDGFLVFVKTYFHLQLP